MFDPTIFENLKVVLEGAVYDLDLTNTIFVSNREDSIDMATMSRTFSLEIQLADQKSPYPFLTISLHSSIKDFALEKLEENEKEAGCKLLISYFTQIKDPKEECKATEDYLNQIWSRRPHITQEISYNFGNEEHMINKIELDFGRKINEDHMDDLPIIVDLAIKPLPFFL